jgi:predicted GNAT family acetyltransferase
MATVEHEAAKDRFVARLDAGEAELTYLERNGRVLDLVHTFVPEEARGQGVAEDLVEFAFDYARKNDYRIKASCPYVRRWLEGHPEKHELLSEPV